MKNENLLSFVLYEVEQFIRHSFVIYSLLGLTKFPHNPVCNIFTPSSSSSSSYSITPGVYQEGQARIASGSNGYWGGDTRWGFSHVARPTRP